MDQTAYMLVGDYTEEDFLQKIIPHLALLRATRRNECIDLIAASGYDPDRLLAKLNARGYAVFQVSVNEFLSVA